MAERASEAWSGSPAGDRLGVGARRQRSFAGYFSISRELVAPDEAAGVDLHIDVGGRLVLYRSRAQQVDAASMEKLRRRQVDEFWIETEDADAYASHLVDRASVLLEGAPSAEARASILRGAARASVQLAFRHIEQTGSYEGVRRTAELTVEHVVSDPAFMPQLIEFVGEQDLLLTRATNTAAYAIALGARQQTFSDQQLHDLGVGALMHDLGLVPLSSALDTSAPLSEVEQRMADRHGKRGYDSMVRAGVENSTVLEIVRDHHGTETGELPSLPAQVVALADLFDDLTNRPGAAVGPFAALYQMRAASGRAFSTELLRDFVLMLGGVPVINPDSPVASVSRRTARMPERDGSGQPRPGEGRTTGSAS
ncbi:MAG: HD domain-containing protein [Dehalococcoidia bacterium]